MYERYVGDSLYCLQNGFALQVKYSDIFKTKKLDTRSGEEIAADIIKKAGLKVVKE